MRFISRNTRPPERRPHGLTLDDVRGLIRKPVSYWAIDESGNPSRKSNENGKAFTLSAVTELSPIDYERLLDGVPLYDGEVHFSKLRNDHPDICIRLMTNLGHENILIVTLSVAKRSKNVEQRHSIPRDELYLFSLLNELISVINEVDLSDLVLISYDRNEQIREETCEMLWSSRCVVMMENSYALRLIQIADLCSSSVGKSLLPEQFADSRYADEISGKMLRIQKGLGGSTQLPSSAPVDYKSHADYKAFSGEGPRIHHNEKGSGLADRTQHSAFAPSETDGLTQRPSAASERRLNGTGSKNLSKNRKGESAWN